MIESFEIVIWHLFANDSCSSYEILQKTSTTSRFNISSGTWDRQAETDRQRWTGPRKFPRSTSLAVTICHHLPPAQARLWLHIFYRWFVRCWPQPKLAKKQSCSAEAAWRRRRSWNASGWRHEFWIRGDDCVCLGDYTKTLTQTISVVFPVALNSRWAGSKQTCFRLRIENRAHKTYIFANGTSWVMLGWGGGGWWGGVGVLTFCLVHTVNVATLPRSLECLLHCYADEISGMLCYVTCCYAAKISGMLSTSTLPRSLDACYLATLPRSLECLLHCYADEISGMLCYVTCCYAAKISGMLSTLHVATLPRSLNAVATLLRCGDLWNALLRYMLLRCRDLWNAFYVTCCYAAKISGMLSTLHVATLPRSLECLLPCYAAEISGMLATLLRCGDLWNALLRYMLLRCRDLWNAFYVTCCHAAEISGMPSMLHVATLPRSLECFLRYMLLRCRDLWNACYLATLPRSLECWRHCYAAEISGMLCYVTCCYPAKISGMLSTLHVATLPRSLGCLLPCYAAEISEDCRHAAKKLEWKKGCLILSDRNEEKNCVLLWRKQHFPKKHPNLDVQICHFSSDTNSYLAVVKHTFFFEKLYFREHGFRSGGMFLTNIDQLFSCCWMLHVDVQLTQFLF